MYSYSGYANSYSPEWEDIHTEERGKKRQCNYFSDIWVPVVKIVTCCWLCETLVMCFYGREIVGYSKADEVLEWLKAQCASSKRKARGGYDSRRKL